ncbi:hypothetical protein Goe21_00530 [Bacillus phage vB_BsuM-Goe21]|nr:hypothetical protein Goe21_00530 [Bacillus phage vB_BsuM-Goe21]
MDDRDRCIKCGNRYGFAMGTCISCGWNDVSNEWTKITVDPNYLPKKLRKVLIKIHESNVGKFKDAEWKK